MRGKGPDAIDTRFVGEVKSGHRENQATPRRNLLRSLTRGARWEKAFGSSARNVSVWVKRFKR